MKAIICQRYGPPDSLLWDDVASPNLGAGDVRIAVKAAGVNFPDLLSVLGQYQRKPNFPFIPGIEVAGDIIEIGDGVQGRAVGDRVIAVLNEGAWAEEAVVPSELVVPMPPNMTYEEGAVFPIVYGTSHVALHHRGHLRAGETLLVMGAGGGVGLTAVEIGKQMGATVIAAASSVEKLELASRYGADYTINYVQDNLRDAIKTITNGRGVDVVYDPVGGEYFEQAARSLAWEGRLLVIGFASGHIPQLAANLVLLKNSAIVGVYWGAYLLNQPSVIADSFRQLLAWYGSGKLKPYISARYPLKEAPKALQALQQRSVLGKQALIMGD